MTWIGKLLSNWSKRKIKTQGEAKAYDGQQLETTMVFRSPQRKKASLTLRSLKVLHGPDQGTTFALWGPKALLGRQKTNHVVLNDDQISRVHLAIIRAEGLEYVQDLGSLNGTFLNGNLVKDKAFIKPGDTIELGSSTLQYLDQENTSAVQQSDNRLSDFSRGGSRGDTWVDTNRYRKSQNQQ